MERPRVSGKFLFAGDEKLLIRGVTYGAFRPDANGVEFHDRELIERDFARMAANGINTVRIPHTTPPRYLLDIAQRHGLRVMVGLCAEQLVGYLIDRRGAPDLERILREKVRTVAGHPALLCFTLGNEIPASLVRWLGRRRVERYLERMYNAVKKEDPQSLVSYVNYPTTEYLRLPFLDLVCFNVYLEDRERFEAYVARLQNIAQDRPLIMSELGLDSKRKGELAQASTLTWLIGSSFAGGCSGVFVFSWTDEWFCNGADVDDWGFGLTDRDRHPKPALHQVRRAFLDALGGAERSWPRISVVVCSYNGGRTIRDCCEGLCRLEYPDFEVIVVDDGSTDDTASIAASYAFKVIRTRNMGLSHARNLGLREATGEIVAYIDDDAYPDPAWLTHLATSFVRSDHAGIGGPNITAPEDGPLARCIGNSPGNPTHVLLTDEEAEHLPGCNMAFRKSALEAIGGFDEQFRIAGDDVDICWRVRAGGGTLGFSPAAMVWHHRRASVIAYLRQQRNYGKAEGMLERKWPDMHNSVGHRHWRGRIYAPGLTHALPLWPQRVYHGVWGTAPFQSIYDRRPGTFLALPLMPECYLLLLLLSGLSALGTLWRPMMMASPLLAVVALALVMQAVLSASQKSFGTAPLSRSERLRLVGMTTVLHLLQPVARLWGRLSADVPPRKEGWRKLAWPWPRRSKIWSAMWLAPQARLASLETATRSQGLFVVHGDDYAGWDLEIRGGVLGAFRTTMAVENHNGGAQLVRLRAHPKIFPPAGWLIALLLAFAGWAALDEAWSAAQILAVCASVLASGVLASCARAAGSYVHGVRRLRSAEQRDEP